MILFREFYHLLKSISYLAYLKQLFTFANDISSEARERNFTITRAQFVVFRVCCVFLAISYEKRI